MNNRDYKKFGPGGYYHIYNRGNNKQNIFLDDDDFNFFLLRLDQNLFPGDDEKSRIIRLPADSFSLISYCLMPNHFHLLLRQNTDIPTSKFITKICTSYSKYFNKKYNRVGHLFQDQFQQIRVDNDAYLVWLSAYIHQNPKMARLVQNGEDWKWSSYRGFAGLKCGVFCDQQVILDQFGDRNDYCNFVENNFENMKRKKEIEHLLLDYESIDLPTPALQWASL